MLTPKKTIPSLAVTMLALTGCGSNGGDGAGGSGGSGGSSLEASIRAFCMNAVECFTGYTLDECINYYNSLVTDYNLTPACEAAAISYLDCGAALSCAEFSSDDNSCSDEFDAIDEHCVPK